jgi:hypothetical protein
VTASRRPLRSRAAYARDLVHALQGLHQSGSLELESPAEEWSDDFQAFETFWSAGAVPPRAWRRRSI